MSHRDGGQAGVLLAMETSGDVCGVAILRDGEFVTEHAFRHEMHLSEWLMGHVDGVLREADTALKDVSLFAVGVGPGSFTGTRIGVMTIKTLAAVLDRPVYGVGGLEAMAAIYGGLKETAVVPILPCRAGTVYTAIYAVGGDEPVALLAPSALPVTELAAQLLELESRNLIVCGAAVDRYRAELSAELQFDRRVSFGSVRFPSASAIGALAWRRYRFEIPPDDPASLVPCYISPPPITMPRTGKTMPDGESKGNRLNIPPA